MFINVLTLLMPLENIIETNTLDQHSLPFSIEEASFSIWLSELESNDKFDALQKVSKSLFALKHIKIPISMRYLFLEKISPLVIQYSEQLQEAYLKSYFPFSNENKLKVELSAKCAIEIAENYAVICKDESFKTKDTFSSPQKQLILVNAIQAMANVLLYNSTLYIPTQKGFWGLCFLFYLFARQHDLLDVTYDQQSTCFITAFKQLLVFNLCNTQQFNTEEIHIIFKWLKQLAGQVELLSNPPKNQVNKVACINLKIDDPPKIIKKHDLEESSYLFYISNHLLLNKLIEFSTNKKNISYNYKILALRLIKTLAMNQDRNDKRHIVNEQLIAELGFDQLITFLLQKESVLTSNGVIASNTQKLSIEDIEGNNNHKDEESYRSELEASLSFLSQPDNNLTKDISSADIWAVKDEEPESEPEEVDPNENATLLDQSNLGYCVGLNDKTATTKIGDIIHLITSSSSTLCVVRRIVPNKNYDVVAGVEILGYNPEILHIMDIEKKQEINACVLTNANKQTIIVIKANDFQNTEYLFADSQDKVLRYKVENVLSSSTTTTKHLKVSLS